MPELLEAVEGIMDGDVELRLIELEEQDKIKKNERFSRTKNIIENGNDFLFNFS